MTRQNQSQNHNYNYRGHWCEYRDFADSFLHLPEIEETSLEEVEQLGILAYQDKIITDE